MRGYDRWAPYYDLVYKDMIDYDAQCRFLRSIFKEEGVPEDGKVLDLGCGTGGHSIPLAEMGYRVTGVDSSESMVQIAAKKAVNLPARFFHQDMRFLELPAKFDATICMFGGFGHVLSSADVRRTLRGISTHLHPGRPFAFEYWSLGGVRPGHTAFHEVEQDELKVTRFAKSTFVPERRMLNIDFEFIIRQGERILEAFAVETPVRVYQRSEMERYLTETGFDINASFDADGLYRKDVLTTFLRSVQRDSFRILCIAAKG
jgi:SAM-dependent methyltransferase